MLLTRSRARLAGAALLPALLLTGCGGGGSDDEGPTPAEVMTEAKSKLDESPSVKIALETDSVPTSGNGVLGATGTVTQAPAFEGEVKVVLNGLTASVPVTSVGGVVYAQLPLQPGYAEIDPGEYGAPDPASFADPSAGLSSLLTQLDGLEEGEQTRSGEEVLTSYSGTLPGAPVKAIIPSADATTTYRTRVGVDEEGFARTVRVTGAFFAGEDDTTYDLRFSDYGPDVEITAPTS